VSVGLVGVGWQRMVGQWVNRVRLFVLAVEIGGLTQAGNQLWEAIGCKL